MTQMLELPDKDFKTYYSCTYYIQKVKWRKITEDLNWIYRDESYSISNEKWSNGISGTLDIAEERINELEHTAVETIQNETGRCKNWYSTSKLRTTDKWNWSPWKGRVRERDGKLLE